MSIPTPRRGKSLESAQRQVTLRKSARKRNVPQTTEVPVKTPESGATFETPDDTFKTPKKRIRCKSMKLDKGSKESKPRRSGCFRIPNILDTRKDEKVCSFYRKTMDPNGHIKFSPSLIKYFMKIDSPESEDLRFKRFNTSFRRERPTNRDSLKIFTEEELNDESKWFQNVPNIVSNMPDIPGSEHRDAFACMPNIDFDFDFDDVKQGKKKRKSVRCTPFKGKPLPDEHLLFDYSVFNAESEWEEAKSVHEEKEEGVENIDISSSLLSSPSDGPMTQNVGDKILLTKEGERKYKDVITKEVSVVLTKLPIQPCMLPCEVKINSQVLTLK